MPETKSHERPLLHCLSRTAAGFLTAVPVATLVTGLCLLYLSGLGFLQVILFLGPVYSLFVGTYCAKTVRNSGGVWQMLLIAAAAAGGTASWYLWGIFSGSIHWYGGFWLLVATTVSGVWVGPTAFNVLRLAIGSNDSVDQPSLDGEDHVAFEVRKLRRQLLLKS